MSRPWLRRLSVTSSIVYPRCCRVPIAFARYLIAPCLVARRVDGSIGGRASSAPCIRSSSSGVYVGPHERVRGRWPVGPESCRSMAPVPPHVLSAARCRLLLRGHNGRSSEGDNTHVGRLWFVPVAGGAKS